MKSLAAAGFATAAIGLLGLTSSCSNNALTTASSPVTSLSGGVSRAVESLSSGAPHVITTGSVTASYKFNSWEKAASYFLPNAFATAGALSTVWDPASGYPRGPQLGFTSNYNGGNLTGCRISGGAGATYQECTNGTTYFPTMISAKSWVGQMLDPNFQNSNGASVTAFGRLQEQLKIICAIGQLIPSIDTDNLPTVGTHTMSFPSDVNATLYKSFASGGCGMDPAGMGGRSAVATVTAASGGIYTKKITLNVGSSITLFLGLDLTAGNLNMMQVEDGGTAGQRNKVSRSILKITSMNNSLLTKTAFEFGSMGYNNTRGGSTSCYSGTMWTCDWEFHRGFIDNANDVAYLITNRGLPGDNATGGTATVDSYVQFSVAGRPREIAACTTTSCSENLALSLGLKGAVNADGSAATYTADYNGCVNLLTRNITTDSTLGCNLTGTTINSGSGAGVIELSRLFYKATTGGIPNVLGTSTENTGLAFTTGPTMYSAATAQ